MARKGDYLHYPAPAFSGGDRVTVAGGELGCWRHAGRVQYPTWVGGGRGDGRWAYVVRLEDPRMARGVSEVTAGPERIERKA